MRGAFMTIETQNETIARMIPRFESLVPEQLAESEEYIDELTGEPIEGDWDPEFIKEINRRVALYKDGKLESVSMDEAFENIRKSLQCEVSVS
jgi:hypothetical protein